MTHLLKNRILLLVSFICLPFLSEGQTNAQSNYLSHNISISAQNIPLEEVLDQIAEEGNFLFSYNADILNGKAHVSIDASNRSIERILRQLLGKEIKTKVIGHHVVLLKSKEENPPMKEDDKPGFLISGFIRDGENGILLPDATIFDVKGNLSATTDEKGFYNISIPAGRETLLLSFCKAGYIDTIVVVKALALDTINIALKSDHLDQLTSRGSDTLFLDPLQNKKLVTALVPWEAQVTSNNLRIHDPRLFQVSLLPFIGTNHLIRGSQTNQLSLNIIAGYSAALQGFEVGGFLNIIKQDVTGIQISGFGNIVGGNTKGVQVAGFMNANSGTMTGVQLAGFSNTISNRFKGAQLAGFSNLSMKDVDGFQISGFANVALENVNLAQMAGFANYGANIHGIQAAGLCNFARGNVKTIQASGFANFANEVGGFQLSGFTNVALNRVGSSQITGFANIASTVEGVQLAGFANLAFKENNGAQVAGFVNYAKNMDGIQVALFNFSDTVRAGVPIGLLSFVRKGYHSLELSGNELFPVNLMFKSGISRFYNVFTSGYANDRFYGGYGFGSKLSIYKRLGASFDLCANMIFTTNSSVTMKGVQYKFAPSLDFRLFKYLTLSAGPSLNLFNSFKINDDSSVPYSMVAHSFYENLSNNIRQQAWLGWNVGLRF